MISNQFVFETPRRKETVRVNRGQLEATSNLPLSVYVAGTSHWSGGVAVERCIEAQFEVERVVIDGAITEQRRNRVDRNAPAFVVIEQVTLGDAIFTQAGREHLVKAGDAYLFTKQGAHEYRTGPSGSLRKQFVHIVGPALPALLRLLALDRRDTVDVANPDSVSRAFRRTFELLKGTDPDWPERVSTVAYELLVLLGKNLTARHPPALKVALTFLEQNLHRQVSLAELCAHTKLSPTHLNRLFQQTLGVAPLKYFGAQKRAWAKQLLRDFSMSIKEVAALVGYEDQLRFSAQFKKHVGVSPRAYRMASGSPDG